MSLSGPFLFDPRAFWEDEDVQLLGWEGIGVYLRLLSRQWEEGSIPRDTRRLRSGLAGGERAGVSEKLIFEILGLFFEECGEDRYQNRRLAVERIAWVKKKKALSKAGRKGGLKSRQAQLKPGLSNRQAGLKPGSSSTSSSSSSSSSSEEKSETEDGLSRPPEDRGRERDSRARPFIPKPERDYNSWALGYPNASKWAEGLKAWCRLKAAERDASKVAAFLEVAVESRQWTQDGGRFVPSLKAFVDGKLWQDHFAAYAPKGYTS